MTEAEVGKEYKAELPEVGDDQEDEEVGSLRPSQMLTSRLSVSLVDSDALAPLFFGCLFLATTAALIFILKGFIADLVISFILVGIFRKPFEWFQRRISKNQWVASGLTSLTILALILVPTLGLIYTIATEAASAYGTASVAFEGEGIIERAHGFANTAGFQISKEVIIDYVKTLATELELIALDLGSSLLGNVLALTMHLAAVLVMVFYILVDGKRLRTFIYRLSPLPDNEDALIVDTFKKVSRGVIVGNGLGSMIQGVFGGLAMWWAGLPSPLLWGSIMALFAFLPLIGISVIAVPAALLLFFEGHTADAVVFLSFCFVQGLLVENIVKTKLMGSAMRLHDHLVFLSILGGIGVFGIIGLIYGPLIAMLFMTLSDLYERHYRPVIARQFSRR